MVGLKFDDLKIVESRHWVVYLDQNQCYLGKSIIWCKDDVNDLLEMSREERDDFFNVAQKLKSVLVKLFKPGLFNYNSLGNENPHLHVHIIPRYKTKRIFEGVTFEDLRFGKSPRPFENPTITEEVVLRIRDSIRNSLAELG